MPFSNVAAPTLCFTLIRVSNLLPFFSHAFKWVTYLLVADLANITAKVGLRTVSNCQFAMTEIISLISSIILFYFILF